MKVIITFSLAFFLLASCQSPEVESELDNNVMEPVSQQIEDSATEEAHILDSANSETTAPEQKNTPAKKASKETKVSKDSATMDPRIQRMLDEKLIKNKIDTNKR